MTCLLIRKGIGKQASVDIMADFLRKSWSTDIQPHFAEEEQHLIPVLNRYEDARPMAATILRDHELLRQAFAHLDQQGLSASLLAAIADQLEQHVRYEERIVFQRLQELLPPEEMARLQFHDDRHNPICNTYPNHFWE